MEYRHWVTSNHNILSSGKACSKYPDTVNTVQIPSQNYIIPATTKKAENLGTTRSRHDVISLRHPTSMFTMKTNRCHEYFSEDFVNSFVH